MHLLADVLVQVERGVPVSIEPYWPDWGACSDPPAESCSDAGCPVHGDETGTTREDGDDAGDAVMNAPQSPLMLSEEVADTFGVDQRTVATWGRKGRLTSIRTPGSPRGHRRYFRAEIEAILAGEPLTPEQITDLRKKFQDGPL